MIRRTASLAALSAAVERSCFLVCAVWGFLFLSGLFLCCLGLWFVLVSFYFGVFFFVCLLACLVGFGFVSFF